MSGTGSVPPDPSGGDRPARRRFDPIPEWVHPGTRLIHGARRAELNAGAVVPPIYQTSTFHYPPEHSEAAAHGDVHLYTRMSNPTLEVAAELIRALEGAQSARVFGSGMGAISTSLLAHVSAGDRVVALRSLYGGSLELLNGLLPRLGVEVRWVGDEEATSPDEVVTPGTRVALIESPTNPRLRVHDIAAWARACDGAGALLFVDSTFATPVNQNPLGLGADLVLHSGTKYLGGHSDLLAGAVAGPEALIERIDRAHHQLGAVLDPFAAFLLTRGLRTLDVRLARQNETGRRMAKELQGHPKVASVHYPGSASAGEEAVAARQMRGRGGMVSISLEGGRPAAKRFLGHLRLVHIASSLGSVESLVSIPSETSHRHLSPDELRAIGVDEGMVRLSFGIEETEDLLRDVREALEYA
ncbi:MAG: trans-sulfuration enzyme family protein [Candidatus Lutacidiplasmatales archaeon]